MSSAPLSDRLQSAARALMIALGDRYRVLPLWAVTYLLKAIDRLRRGAVDLLRKLEAGTYRPRKSGLARRPSVTKPAPRPAPAIPFPSFRGILNELIGNQRGDAAHELRELLQDPALPAHVQTCPGLGRRLRPLCRLTGIAIPDWLRKPKTPRRPRGTPAPAARPTPDPSKPNWRMLRDACRADFISRQWHASSAPPHLLVHNFRTYLSPEVIALLRPHFKFLQAL